MSKYVSDSVEAQYQPGSERLVLANKLAIVDETEMDDVEAVLLIKLYENIFITVDSESVTFSFQNVANWHRQCI